MTLLDALSMQSRVPSSPRTVVRDVFYVVLAAKGR